VAILATGLVAGADRKDKGSPDKSRAAEKGGQAAPLFDLDAFLKANDRNKDGYLSRDELPERFRHNFNNLDTDKDGKLSRQELARGAVYLQSGPRPSDVVFLLVEMSDCDECCAEELQIIYDFLRKLDNNKDGKIHADELKASREELISKRIAAIFRNLDANKDGKISREEAKGQIKRHFDELDANQDGFIDRGELTRAAAENPRNLPARQGTPLLKDKATESPRQR